MSLALRPTFSESWYRVVNLRPRLRPTAQISRQYYRGERWYVVRDPAGNQFHRLSDPAYRFVGLLDGSRTIGEAWDLVGGQLADDAPTQPEVIQILSQLFAANLIETDVTPDSAVVLKRQKLHNQRQMQQKLMNILFPRIPIWDPDRFIRGWMPVIKLMISWLGAAIWLAVIIGAVIAVAPMWDELQAAAKNAIDPGNWAWLWVTFVLIKFIHEMGHAFSCRRFGGEVHEVGIMLLVLVPTPYVDASTAWAFPNKWKRVFVGAGGMIFELFVAAVCAFIWKATYGSGDNLINQLAYNTLLIASVSTIVFNANPLLRYDGYYILSDFWEIPNLQRKSTEYALGLVKRHIFRVKLQQPLPPLKQRIELFVYAITSSCYRIFVSLAIAYMLFFTLPQEIKVVGLIMGATAMITFAIFPLFKLTKYLATEPELHRKRGRAIAFTVAVAALLIAVVGIIRFPVTVRAEGILEAAARQTLRVQTPGFVDKVLVKDGDLVEKGQLLMVLRNEEETTKLATDTIEYDIVGMELRSSRVADAAKYTVDLERQIRLERLLKEQKDKVTKLELRSPIAGRVVAPELHNLHGTFLPKATEIVTVTEVKNLEAFVMIDQADRDRLTRTGDYSAELRVAGDVDTVVPVTNNIFISPAAKREVRSAALTHAGGGTAAPDAKDPKGTTTATQNYEARLVFNNPDEGYFPGQRAYVRFKSKNPEPLAVQAYRWFQQLTMQSTQS
ncbi:MAG TPA: biotin/lipoyl-binding protein [Tepidisphaeraceae bacterium]|jgi:putative peptide zinc metalloprotease protein